MDEQMRRKEERLAKLRQQSEAESSTVFTPAMTTPMVATPAVAAPVAVATPVAITTPIAITTPMVATPSISTPSNDAASSVAAPNIDIVRPPSPVQLPVPVVSKGANVTVAVVDDRPSKRPRHVKNDPIAVVNRITPTISEQFNNLNSMNDDEFLKDLYNFLKENVFYKASPNKYEKLQMLNKIIPVPGVDLSDKDQQIRNVCVATFRQAFTHSTVDAQYNYETLEKLGDKLFDSAFVSYYLTLPAEYPKTAGAINDVQQIFTSKSFQTRYGKKHFEKMVRAMPFVQKKDIYEDVLEAFVAALFLNVNRVSFGNLGYPAVQEFVEKVFRDQVLKATLNPRTFVEQVFERMHYLDFPDRPHRKQVYTTEIKVPRGTDFVIYMPDNESAQNDLNGVQQELHQQFQQEQRDRGITNIVSLPNNVLISAFGYKEKDAKDSAYASLAKSMQNHGIDIQKADAFTNQMLERCLSTQQLEKFKAKQTLDSYDDYEFRRFHRSMVNPNTGVMQEYKYYQLVMRSKTSGLKTIVAYTTEPNASPDDDMFVVLVESYLRRV